MRKNNLKQIICAFWNGSFNISAGYGLKNISKNIQTNIKQTSMQTNIKQGNIQTNIKQTNIKETNPKSFVINSLS